MAAFFGANEIWKTYEGDGREPVILVGVRELDAKEPVSEEEFRHSLSELAELAKACEMNPVDTITQPLAHINTGLYVGAGKADEIRVCAEMFEAERVIFNDTLSPSQIRNLQKLLKLPVMDRTALILEIFERRARTREARLRAAPQVPCLPRVKVRPSWRSTAGRLTTASASWPKNSRVSAVSVLRSAKRDRDPDFPWYLLWDIPTPASPRS